MKILFDQGTPEPLRRFLLRHVVDTAYERRWHQLKNGELIQMAEADGYDLLVTTDQNLKYQQNLKSRSVAIVVLLSASWPRIQSRSDAVVEAIDSVAPGGFAEVAI